MEWQHSVTLDLYEEKLQRVVELIQTDPEYFLESEMWALLNSYQWKGGNLSQLVSELHRLVQLYETASLDARAFVDYWGESMYNVLDLTAMSQWNQLMYLVYTGFENTDILQLVGERYGWTKDQLLQQASEEQVYGWFALWLCATYPALSVFLLGKNTEAAYRPLTRISVQQIIQYLPEFMIWRMKPCLMSAHIRTLTVALAMGKNVRQAQCCPMPFTKRMAHHFTNAPKEMTFNQAVWYSIVMGLNGNEALMIALKRHFRHWKQDMGLMGSLVGFFKDLPIDELPMQRFLAYLRHLWQENGELCMKGWTLATLQRRTDAWYEELRRRYTYVSNVPSWKGATYRPFECMVEGMVYKIVQLTTAEELFEEGKQMSHCVASYGYRCVNGEVSVWSLRKLVNGKTKSLVTIELSAQGRIVQMACAFNESPNMFQTRLIQRWATREELCF